MPQVVKKAVRKNSTSGGKKRPLAKKAAAKKSVASGTVHLLLKSPPQKSMLPLIKKVKGVVRLSARKVLDAYPKAFEIMARYGGHDHIMTLDYRGVPRWTRVPKAA
jgi:hypothetical protein